MYSTIGLGTASQAKNIYKVVLLRAFAICGSPGCNSVDPRRQAVTRQRRLEHCRQPESRPGRRGTRPILGALLHWYGARQDSEAQAVTYDTAAARRLRSDVASVMRQQSPCSQPEDSLPSSAVVTSAKLSELGCLNSVEIRWNVLSSFNQFKSKYSLKYDRWNTMNIVAIQNV